MTAKEKAVGQTFASGNDFLAAAIYKESTQCTNSNFVSAPFLVAANLALACCAAKDDTAYEIRDSIKIPCNQSEMSKLVKEIMSRLKTNKNVYLRVANRIYLHDSFAVRKDFFTLIEDFHIDIKHVSFTNPLGVVNAVNGWMSQQTDGKISNFCQNDDVMVDFQLILVSGLCFKGYWLKAYQRENMYKKTFYISRGVKINVDFMEKTAIYHYSENEDLKVKMLKLTFESKDLEMVFVLPYERDGLAKVEEQVEKIFGNTSFTEERVQVQLPKFKIESKLNHLRRTLQHIGIKLIFKEEADFSNLLAEKKVLHINEVFQHVLVEFCEEDTKGGTGIKVASSGRMFVPGNKLFIADHPFIFYITVNNFAIVTGRVVNPQQF